MGDEETRRVVLPDHEDNTEVATVDGISLSRGDPEPKELTDDQIERLKAAGCKLDVLDDEEDPLDKIRTHDQADAALAAEGITVGDDVTTVEGKVQALRDDRSEDDDQG